MRLPQELQAAIDAETASIAQRDRMRAVAELTGSYQQREARGRAIDSAAKLAAYLQVRLPATFAADSRVFAEIASLRPDWQPRSLLDLGAGPGTAVWAALKVFPSIQEITLVERESRIVEAGRRLAATSQVRAIRDAVWLQSDLREANVPDVDLVVVSYALGEMAARDRPAAVTFAWSHAKDVLVIVGPGTPADFATILSARTQLLDAGAHIVAPCPHETLCPMNGTRDWCHFAQRLERTSDHRRLKSGDLSYEDEKFSYLVVSGHAVPKASARIVRHPQKHGGHVQLSLCTNDGLKQATITKSQGDKYRLARKAEWGEAWDADSSR